MERYIRTALFTFGSILILCAAIAAQQIGETPAVTTHLSEADIESGRVGFDEVIEHGRHLFSVTFNRLDGQGRPSTTSDGQQRAPVETGMARTAGPDSHSCVSCHNQPRAGGGGDFATNGFVMDQSERNTPGMFGSGPIEMLALEMTRALHAIRIAAVNQAYLTQSRVPAHLVAKGIDFGWIEARWDGSIDTTGVRGVSSDLVIRPFHQHGAAVSLRQFTNEGMNQHMGLQSQELFGINTDPDGDGVQNELTVGDITALSIFQAQLGTPGRVIPDDPARRKAVHDGEALFNTIGCGDCHVPAMKLNSPIFTEPNAFNPEWKLPVTVVTPVSFDMTKDGEWPRLEPAPDGGAVVRAYTDLKRHNLCDSEDRFFCNETKAQPGIPVSSFITRKLWDAGSSAPYGHRGDLSTLTEAIEHHAGEARPARTNFVNLSTYERAAVIEFLKSLQILPPGSPLVISESQLKAAPRTAARDRRPEAEPLRRP
jgi:hypothetical protein